MISVRNRFALFSMILTLVCSASFSFAQSRFSVVLNENSNFGDSRRSVTFYDADDLGSGPLFSVFTGYESSNNFDEPNSIAVDPATGDVYILAYDSGVAGALDSASGNGIFPGPDGDDTEGDYDLLRINFSTVFTNWKANYQGVDVRAPLIVGGPAPTQTDGTGNPYVVNQANTDYVTYGVQSPDHSAFDFALALSNTVLLPNAIEKIGEVKRNVGDSTGFFQTSLEFVDQNTLLLIDDANEDSGALETAAGDHSYRILERVSTSPGAANDALGDYLDGGYNRGTTESWESRNIGLVNQDFSGGVPIGHSEVESSAYYRDPLTGVRGMWVTEGDGGGDDIAFFEIDSSGNGLGYRPHAVGAGPNFPTSFALDNDPAVNSAANDGKADNIWVDQDTGDLIIIEGGFGDTADGVPGGDHEPSVIRREVLSYDDGLGKIQFGSWSSKVILDPNTDETPGENNSFLERGQWAAYDSVEDLVYFWNPGNGGAETPEFALDVWVLDINTGITTAFLDLDDSTSLFQSSGVGDKTDFFTLSTVGQEGDFDGDGDVDGNDFLEWQRTDGTSAGLSAWQNNYGLGSPISAANAVPEPTTALMLLVGVVLMPLATRRRS